MVCVNRRMKLRNAAGKQLIVVLAQYNRWTSCITWIQRVRSLFELTITGTHCPTDCRPSFAVVHLQCVEFAYVIIAWYMHVSRESWKNLASILFFTNPRMPLPAIGLSHQRSPWLEDGSPNNDFGSPNHPTYHITLSISRPWSTCRGRLKNSSTS